jgi:hypothetical protein
MNKKDSEEYIKGVVEYKNKLIEEFEKIFSPFMKKHNLSLMEAEAVMAVLLANYKLNHQYVERKKQEKKEKEEGK